MDTLPSSSKSRFSRAALVSLLGAVSAVAVGLLALGANSDAQTPATPKTVPATDAPATDAPGEATLFDAKNTDAVVEAANAFLATLSPAQRKVAQIEFTPDNAARWSNFPAGFVPRNGIFFRDMNAAQAAAALKVARLALSENGFNRMQGVRAGDDAYATSEGARSGRGGFGGPSGGGFGGFGRFGDAANGPDDGGPDGFGGPNGGPNGRGGAGGGPGGGGGNLFGAGNYIIAFLGQPSKTAPWLLEFGGHHLAFNLTYKGNAGASTPYFVGVQPSVWKDDKGVTHEPLAEMHNTMRELLGSLSPAQMKQAFLNVRFSDVYVGPGKDARFPTRRDGVPTNELSPASKRWVERAIAAWTGDAVQGAQYQKLYESELNQTKVAYSGGAALDQNGDYVRIDGPHVWIEFSMQGTDHYHTIWRDRVTDYGAQLIF